MVESRQAAFHTGEDLSPAGGMAVDSDGNVYISDEFNHRIALYSPDGELVKTAGSKGAGNSELHYPRGLALSVDGLLYIADSWNHRVVVYDRNLVYQRSFGTLGSGPGQLDEPVAVCLLENHIAVLEKSNHRIQLFTGEGRSVGTIGKRGSVAEETRFYSTYTTPDKFSLPVFEFPSAMTKDDQGRLYVADTNNHRITRINADFAHDPAYRVTGLYFPAGLAVDTEGNLHVAEFNRSAIQVISPRGVKLGGYASGVEVPGPLTITDGRLLAADSLQPVVAITMPETGHDNSGDGRGVAAFKEALFHLQDGEWPAATDKLAAAAEDMPDIGSRSSIVSLSAYTFPASRAARDQMEPAGPFGEKLEGQAVDTLARLEERLQEKALAAEELAGVELAIEKELDAGRMPGDDLQLHRHNASKKIFGLDAEIKKLLARLRKSDEFLHRLALCGPMADNRIEQLTQRLETFIRINEIKEKWYHTAEKEAPALTFGSSADQRRVFAEAQKKIAYTDHEFSGLAEMAAFYNHEVTYYAERANPSTLADYTVKALDVFAALPFGLSSLRKLLIALPGLLSALNAETVEALGRKINAPELWPLVVKEENIPAGPGSAFRLLAAVFCKGDIPPATETPACNWDQIAKFYHTEFERFPKEHEPLRAELLKLQQQYPLALKTDPGQTAELDKKIGLLTFHNYFQERYISSMMREYLLRYAWFHSGAKPHEEALTLLAALPRMKEEIQKEQIQRELKLVEPIDPDLPLEEKNQKRLEKSLTETIIVYYYALLKIFTHALRGLPEDILNGRLGLLPVRKETCTAGSALAPIQRPRHILCIEDEIYGMTVVDPFLFSISEDGNKTSRFGVYGQVEGMFSDYTRNICRTGLAGQMAVVTGPRRLDFYTADGTHTQGLMLDLPDGLTISHVEMLPDGGICATAEGSNQLFFLNPDGSSRNTLTFDGDSLPELPPLYTTIVTGENICVGGNGKLVVISHEGKLLQESNAPDLRTLYDGVFTDDGRFYGISMENNTLLAATAGLQDVVSHPLPTEISVSIDVVDRSLAVADFWNGAVLFFDLPS